MKRILVVDDEPDVIDLVKNRLEANRYKVISATDGDEGLIKAQKEKPDLVIMDILMPNMMGGEAVRQLRSDESTKHIPIIFLTAVTSRTPNGDGGVNVDGQFYTALPKPFKPEKLLFEIKRLIGDG